MGFFFRWVCVCVGVWQGSLKWQNTFTFWVVCALRCSLPRSTEGGEEGDKQREERDCTHFATLWLLILDPCMWIWSQSLYNRTFYGVQQQAERSGTKIPFSKPRAAISALRMYALMAVKTKKKWFAQTTNTDTLNGVWKCVEDGWCK